jgi:hypothetical protein
MPLLRPAGQAHPVLGAVQAQVRNVESLALGGCPGHGLEDFIREAGTHTSVVHERVGMVVLAHHFVVGDREDGSRALFSWNLQFIQMSEKGAWLDSDELNADDYAALCDFLAALRTCGRGGVLQTWNLGSAQLR